MTALTTCIIAGVRRRPGERFTVPADRAAALTACGHILPDGYLDLLPAAARALWRDRPVTGLTGASLVCDDATAARLWASAGRILAPDELASDVPTAAVAAPVAPDALRVLQLTTYDPGSSVYRYHSAANTVPGVVSAFARFGYSNPHCHLRQWDGDLHRRTVELLAMTADVIHVHMDYRALHQQLRYAVQPHQRVAITYHGSVLPGDEGRVFVDDEADRRQQAIRFGARPYHARYGVEHYLPIPVPVADYAALAAATPRPDPGITVRVAHSPTKRAIKGTTDFLAAVDALRARGLGIEAVLIEDLPHGEALRLKATCHATFDSFWLGMQGSGIEAAAMGQAVLAGDATAAAEATALNDQVIPWTFTPDGAALTAALTQLVRHAQFLRAEAARVHAYVRRVHDYPVVGARYQSILATEVRRGAADRH